MYLDVTLNREYKKESTLGELLLPSGRVLKTIERPWVDNKANISCIPEGIYLVKWLNRSASGKYKRVWHVQNVIGRSGILFHSGNFVRHSLGCILPGLKSGKMSGVDAVLSSKAALNKMRSELSGKDFILFVTSNK